MVLRPKGNKNAYTVEVEEGCWSGTQVVSLLLAPRLLLVLAVQVLLVRGLVGPQGGRVGVQGAVVVGLA